MQINLHQTHHLLADFQGIEDYLKDLFNHPETRGLHIFPELFLTGYPLLDLCLQQSFIDRYQKHLGSLQHWAQKEWQSKQSIALLVGGIAYDFDGQGLVKALKNVVYEIRPGQEFKIVATKKLLPNYDIFDEEKYFAPGNETQIYEFEGKKLGLLICEDMWTSSHHDVDPVKELYQFCEAQKTKLDGIINLSASPYFLGKLEKRLKRASEISTLFGSPMVYVNRVGGEDEVLFDGQSFVISGDKVVLQAKAFKSQIASLELPETFSSSSNPSAILKEPENTWEDLFKTNWQITKSLPKLHPLSDADCKDLLKALIFGLQEYTQKSGHKKFSVALSGGIDSSLVLAIAKLSMQEEQEIEAIFMPGFYSATQSYDDSATLCKNLNIRLRNLSIKFFHSSIKNAFKESFNEEMQGLADENIQSRLRGTLLYARSNQWNSLVINTSNKSEIAVGYSTLYGDSVGAISLLGDLYKTEVFQLAEYINKTYNDLIPRAILTREPTAELRENQSDSQSLPPYERLDAILEGFLSYRMSEREILGHGFDPLEVKKVYGLYQKSEYKRKQFCPIIKVKPKSFGFGYRVPISKKMD